MLDGRWCLIGSLLVVGCSEDESADPAHTSATGASQPDDETPPDPAPEDDGDPDEDDVEAEPEAATRTVGVRNESDTPFLVNTYPGFRVSNGEASLPRWTCAAECGACDFGECGCAPNSVSEILPGETLELEWSGVYWQEREGCDDVCADRLVAADGVFTVTLEYGTEALDDGGCAGESLVGDVQTVSVDFEHPGNGMVEVVLPGA